MFLLYPRYGEYYISSSIPWSKSKLNWTTIAEMAPNKLKGSTLWTVKFQQKSKQLTRMRQQNNS